MALCMLGKGFITELFLQSSFYLTFKEGSYYTGQAGLELVILSQPLKYLGLQVLATTLVG